MKIGISFSDGGRPQWPLESRTSFPLIFAKKNTISGWPLIFLENLFFFFVALRARCASTGQTGDDVAGSLCVSISRGREMRTFLHFFCVVCVSVNWRFPTTDNRLLSFSLILIFLKTHTQKLEASLL